MKQIFLLCLMILCSALSPSSIAQSSSSFPAQLTTNESDAKTTMSQYFMALSNGDSASLETLLGGQLLEKRKRLLANPAYSSNLQKIYQNADFSVLSYQINGPDLVTVEASITLGEGERIRKSYQLRRLESENQQSNFVIVSETAIAESL